MEEEKKAKRPRIGETRGAVREELTPNNEKKEYSNYTEGRNTENQSSYNNERRQYNNGYNRGGYNNRYNNNRSYNNGGYNNRYSNPNEGENTNNDDTQQENNYTRNNYNRGYNNNRSSYNNNRGGYNNRNNYNNRSGYNNNRYNNGYNNRYNNDVERTESDSTQNSYSQERSQNSEGTYNRNNYNNGYNNERRQYNNGYNRNNYNNNRGEGYNNNRNSYNNNRGGYNNNRNSYNNNRSEGYNNNNRNGYNNQRGGFNTKRFTPRPQRVEYELPPIDPTQPIRLNKFLANAGLCSRREADEFIQAGEVQVNGEVVTELGSKITPADIITFRGKEVGLENKVYILLNKPKDCVTTADDPQGRLTVMDIVRNACTERIYPVGRLDRNTTGVLLLTNDGDLASKLTHPKFVKKKIYHVWTDKDVTEEDMQRIADGIDLDDGSIHADAVSYATETDRNQVGIEIHSGRNRIVRRIFEALGYRVIKLDRVYFAGLTKKNLPRGRWRHLTQAEVNMLMMGSFE